MKIAIYLRVSTKDQSIKQQKKILEDYARARGWAIEYIFKDEGISAKKINRPGYLEILEVARKRLIDGILVFKIDRFARSLKQIINNLEEFKSLGIEFISYTENIDTTTPAGKAMFQLIGVFAEFERDMISEATRDRLAALKNLGKPLGRPPKLNYEKIKDYAHAHPKKSQRTIAKDLGISLGSVNNALRPERPPGSSPGTDIPPPSVFKKRGSKKSPKNKRKK